MRKRVVLAPLAVLALLAGYVVADAADVVPGPLTTRRVIPEPAPFPEPTAVPAPVPTVAGGPAALPAGGLQSMADELAASPELGTVAVNLVDAATGEVVGARDAASPRTPASSLKLLTGIAALEVLGPGRTLTTSATWDGTTLTLVGGGDLLLGVGEPSDGAVGYASLTDLAAEAAAELGARGVTSVALAVDDTLFSGPATNPAWGALDRLFVMPMASLALDAGRSGGGYQADPAMAAAGAFATELEAAGITVVRGPTRAPTPAGAATVGEVVSAPLAEVVRWTLKESDNSLAEALGRLVAVERGDEGSAAAAPRAVLDTITELGLPTTGVTLEDTSGLASGTRVTAELLTDAIVLSLDPAHPRLRGLVTSLPVAHLDGTLADRIEGAAGRVRAKTGTLLSVASLSGIVHTDDGATVVFSVLANDLPVGGVEAARARLDEFVTALAAPRGLP